MKTIRLHGKTVGKVIEDGGWVYVTHRHPHHYFRKFQGFGISEEILERLIKMNVGEIRVVYHGKKGEKVLVTRPYKFLVHGEPYKHPNFDKQIILAEKEFEQV